MNLSPSSSEWAAARGDKWAAQLSAMEATLAPVDAPLISALQVDAPVGIADVGCGGGATAREILRRAPRGTTIDGFDVSSTLVEHARQRLSPDERDRVTFAVADVATAAPARAYDRLVSRFGVMFFDDPAAAFANLLGWLAPGGRFAFAVWGRLSENTWMTGVRDVVARIVDVPKTDHEAPGPYRYADAAKLIALLDGAGFRELDVHEWRGTLPVGGGLPPAEAARFALSAFSAFGDLLAAAGDGAVDEAQRKLTVSLSARAPDGIVRMDAAVHIVTGAR